METKICKRCGVEKTIEEYRKWFSKKDNNYYYRCQCRNCEREISSNYYNSNKQYFSDRYIKNKEEINKKRKLYYENNKHKKREYYLKNKEKIDKYQKEYRIKNREKSNNYSKIYNFKKRKSDNIYAFKVRIRHIIWLSFNKKGMKKNEKAENILGCSLEKFTIYLLQTFKNNYGYDWDGVESVHIDHIKPLKLAKTEKEVIKLNHYTNLQLLKAEDNLHKADKLNWGLFT